MNPVRKAKATPSHDVFFVVCFDFALNGKLAEDESSVESDLCLFQAVGLRTEPSPHGSTEFVFATGALKERKGLVRFGNLSMA